jgi:hypothetical protein
MVVPALIGGGGAILQALMQSGAQQDAHNIALMNLYQQQRSNQDQYSLATAPRQDAYGNRTSFSHGEGFRTELSPIQQALLDAQQGEQLRGFREDAPRARDAAVRQDRRSTQADEVFRELLSRFQHQERPLEKDHTSQAVLESLDVLNSSAGGRNNPDLGNLMLRMGDNASLPGVVRATQQQQPNLSEVLSTARRAGREDFATAQQQRSGAMLPELQAMRSIADGTPGAQLNYNNTAGQASAGQDQMLDRLLQTIARGSQAQSGAMQGVMQTAGQTPNISPIFAALQQFAAAQGGSGGDEIYGQGGRTNPLASSPFPVRNPRRI